MLKSVLTASLLSAAIAAGAVTATPAMAKDGRNGAFAAGAAAGIVGGALLGSAAQQRTYYEPAPVYAEPECYVQRERYYDGYRYRTRRVEVCN